MGLNKTDEDFALKLYKDSNAVDSKTQIYFFLHNATCFKYRVAANRKCWFDFLLPCTDQMRVIELSLIDVSQKNP